ncbi:EIN3-binding F-box protein 1 [Lactuca sativa]|uniref:F-box domain-containing protein n=1 Tax=Lactuca sativa TaxID=4236 RepID=A0A9R1V648_LACSA|nr:EIN3-binding F-box protein 1 [Lactuca sativa]KAJ0200068.1 hypothetical protein LSAT_V11C600306930 [Lactuca sativa]
MQKLVGYSGEGDFSHGKSMYTNPMDLGIFTSHGHHMEVYSLPCKRSRSRISAPFIFNEQIHKKPKTTIEILPDECLFEIFKRLNGTQERSSCASVSKHWLNLLSTIRKDEFTHSLNQQQNAHLSRFLKGKKATDIRLLAIAVGASSHGGLGSLSINGNNVTRGVTNLGLKAISRNCPSLTDLSLWNLSSISDEAIIEIANECHNLEKLDFCQIPISDNSLIAIAKNCPNLKELSIESCSNIGNEGLQAIGQSCQNLKSISIKNCSQVVDQGITSLLSSSSSYSLMKLKLESLNISDMSLAVIGHYGIEITDLALTRLCKVTEKGFWVMGSGQGLQKLKSLTITSCFGVTDLGLEALGRGCPNLKQFALRKSAFLSDNGIVSFAEVALSLETILLEECHRVTQCGVFNFVLKSKLKNLTLENCFGIKDLVPGIPIPFRCSDSVKSLSIRNCPGFGNNSLMLFGRICPQLQNVEFIGLHGITDECFAPLIECCEPGLVSVSLSSCPKLTDKLVSELCKIHGGTLEILNLDGCTSITDSSLVSIASDCLLLTELGVSGSGITDSGVRALACAVQLNLQILSISNCRFVSDKSLPFLVKLSESLVGLNVRQCHGISNSGVGLLVDRLWNCDILS